MTIQTITFGFAALAAIGAAVAYAATHRPPQKEYGRLPDRTRHLSAKDAAYSMLAKTLGVFLLCSGSASAGVYEGALTYESTTGTVTVDVFDPATAVIVTGIPVSNFAIWSGHSLFDGEVSLLDALGPGHAGNVYNATETDTDLNVTFNFPTATPIHLVGVARKDAPVDQWRAGVVTGRVRYRDPATGLSQNVQVTRFIYTTATPVPEGYSIQHAGLGIAGLVLFGAYRRYRKGVRA